MTNIHRTQEIEKSQRLVGARVAFIADDRHGYIRHVMVDKHGMPWSLSVEVDGEKLHEIVAPEEVVRIDIN